MNKLTYDLHIHSCLSPCGDEDMTPANIVGMSSLKNLDIIAVTDHNSCKNCPAVMELAEEYNLLVLPGMELCTMEEVHVLCLFTELYDAMAFDEYVYSQLIKIPNDEAIFGKQEIYDASDQKIGSEPYLLINATQITFDSLGKLMEEFHGVYIPAHLDKSSNSLLSNLGFVPPEADFRAAELANISLKDELSHKNPYLLNCNVLTNSDAHYLEHISEAVNFLPCMERSREAVLQALVR
jgi:3',5'-nucleoside bisphosphate phosphatase